MSPLHGPFDSMFSPSRLGELSDSTPHVGDDLDSLHARLDLANSCTKQLAIMLRTLYQAASQRGAITDDEYRTRLEQVNLGEWTHKEGDQPH